MAMFEFEQAAVDDPGFVTEVTSLVEGAVEACAPTRVVIVKIDNWFGSKWLGFSHKVMGAFGMKSPRELVIPPFVPNRVLSERVYERMEATFIEKSGAPRMHIEQESEANARRKVRDVHPGAALFWWTGNTGPSGRGALMAYLPTSESHIGWYAELQRKVEWGFGALGGIGVPELRRIRARAAQLRH